MATDEPKGVYYKYYHYDPSLAGAVVFTILFGCLTLAHIGLVAKHRLWYFVPLIIGGLFEIAGYVARAVSHTQAPDLTLAPYVIQTLLLLVAPPLFAATLYMVLGRIIRAVKAEQYSVIKTRWLTTVFVTSDVVCFIVQLGGAGLMASSHASTSTTGSYIVLAGLIVQIIIFGLFVVVALVVHRRMQAAPTSDGQSLPWEVYVRILYATSGLILVRSIVRVAEFVEGFDGYIIRHESFLYVFDGQPMAAVMVILAIWFPSAFPSKTDAAVSRSDKAPRGQ